MIADRLELIVKVPERNTAEAQNLSESAKILISTGNSCFKIAFEFKATEQERVSYQREPDIKVF